MRALLVAVACSVVNAIVMAGDGQPFSGRLCVAGSECRDYTCGQPLASSSSRRPFTIASSNGTAHWLSVIDAGETRIPCDGYGAFELKVSVPTLPKRSSVRVHVADEKDGVWDLQLGEKQLRTPLRVQVRDGLYRLTVESPHFARVRKSVLVGETSESVVADLTPLPTLSATVVARSTGRGVGGALIVTDLNTVAVANPTGRFTIEVDPDNWPANLNVSAGGYADTTVRIPRAHVSAILRDIYMSLGGSIVVELTRDEPAEAVQVDLERLPEGSTTGIPVKSLPAAPGERTKVLTFDNVEPGPYVVLAKGPEPCERRGLAVDLRGGEEKTVRMGITPFRLHVQVQMSGEVLPGAHVMLRNKDGRWEGGRFSADDTGQSAVKLWQGGNTSAWVSADVLTRPFIERRLINDGEDTDWLLDVPALEITGVVVDAASGAAIPNAALLLRVSGDGSSLTTNTRADKHGNFRFAPVAYGQHTLKAGAADYQPAEMSYSFLEPEQSRAITVPMEAASLVQLTALDPRGAPIPGARLIQYHGLTQSGVGTTDDSGTARIPIPKDDSRDVYVIPRDGSFGFVQLRPDTPQASVQIAAGVSRIVLRVESESHQPIPNVSVLIRYNLHLLPPLVVQTLASLQGATARSGADGQLVLDRMPPGLYEFWPGASDAELQSLAASAGSDAPAKMTVTPGENLAVMTFAHVEKP